MKTVVLDIETVGAIAATSKESQLKLVLDNSISGFKAGEMALFSGGRGAGKSTLSNYYSMKVSKNRYYGATDRIFWNDTNLCKEIVMPEPKKPKYQFSRAHWYKAPRPGHASWNTFSNEYHEILTWCVENFGPHPKRPDAWSRWYMGVESVVFRDEVDYILYQLRWS